MKVKLYKTEKENYVLVDPTKGTYDNGYMLGTSRESQYNKLSIKNCQAIERGYDLDELAMEACDCEANECDIRDEFKKGFQKCLELMGDKKFSEDDVVNIAEYVRVASQSSPSVRTKDLFNEYQSLQQTEWDVEIEMEEVAIGDKYTPEPKPKLDADGCLILKRI